jgi:hypothetical protein
MIAIDVLCAGFACYDLVYCIDYHPQDNEKIFASAFISCGGGPAANAAVLRGKFAILLQAKLLANFTAGIPTGKPEKS